MSWVFALPLRNIIPFGVRLRVEVEVFRTLARGSRIVEYPFIIGNADISNPCKTLVFGCFNDFAAIQLASVGFEVVGFDIVDNVFNHPSFQAVKGDFLQTAREFSDESFDLAFALSSLEHAVVDSDGRVREDGDQSVTAEIFRLLKKDGRFLLTVPFGQSGLFPRDKPRYRKYDRKALRQLLKSYQIYHSSYFGCTKNGAWLPCAPETLENEPPSDIPKGVACICARK